MDNSTGVGQQPQQFDTSISETLRRQHYLEGMNKRRDNPAYHQHLSQSGRAAWRNEPSRTNLLNAVRNRDQEAINQKNAEKWTEGRRREHGKLVSEKNRKVPLADKTPEERKILMNLAREVLNEQERKAYFLQQDGMCNLEIAKQLHYTGVSSLLSRARWKLAKAQQQASQLVRQY